MRKNNVFCRELANTRQAKELKAFFCIRRKPTNFCHPGSLLLTLTNSSSISGSLCHYHSRTIGLTPAHSGSLRHLLAHKVLARFARSLSNPAIWSWISSSQMLHVSMTMQTFKRRGLLLFLSEFICYSHALKILIFLNWEG